MSYLFIVSYFIFVLLLLLFYSFVGPSPKIKACRAFFLAQPRPNLLNQTRPHAQARLGPTVKPIAQQKQGLTGLPFSPCNLQRIDLGLLFLFYSFVGPRPKIKARRAFSFSGPTKVQFFGPNQDPCID